MADPIFFAAPGEFRCWLEEHHEGATELWVGFYKKATGRPSLTWPQSVDEALCFGWIDGIRKTLGAESYMIRFTPRKPGSNWSAVNVARMQELERAGRVKQAGRLAFERRVAARTGIYAYEQRKSARFDPEMEAEFRAEPEAWAFFQSRPPSYRQTSTWWVMSAKRPETRQRRLDRLIEISRDGKDLV
jgi:uncharacterized protein YdeI (YjbR/CyaY-like superfamily)